MNNIGYLSIFFIILVTLFFENILSALFLKFNFYIPFTFLVFSYIHYKKTNGISATGSFFIGILVDLISQNPFGLNALMFCLMALIISYYKNIFKLFSYFQICIFFSLSATFYVGFTNLISNIGIFSYTNLFSSLLASFILCISLSFINLYNPRIKNRLGIRD
jgi:rod shape-determining protein MreD